VLEHLPEQHRVFEKLAALMHKNSKLLINIPIIDSYAWDTYGMNAFQLGDVPRHYYLHSVKSFTSLAKQHHLQIEDSLYCGGDIIFADSEKLKRNIILHDKLSFSKRERAFFRKETKQLIAAKQTGLCCFYLSLK
jgi:hypothetical protein